MYTALFPVIHTLAVLSTIIYPTSIYFCDKEYSKKKKGNSKPLSINVKYIEFKKFKYR